MKIDCETLFHTSKVDRKSDAETIEGNIDDLDSKRLSSGQKIMKEGEAGVLLKPNGLENDVDQSAYKRAVANELSVDSILGYTVSVDNSANYKENHEREKNLPCSHPTRETISLENDSDKLYLDKSVMEYELPELLVCNKDGPENVIKDICVDEGVPCKKTSFENVAEKRDENYLHPEKKNESDLTKGVADTSMPIMEGVKFPEKSDSDREYSLQCDSKYSRQSWDPSSAALEKIANKNFKENVSLVELCSVQKMDNENTSCNEAGKQSIQIENNKANSCGSGSISEAEESNSRAEQVASAAQKSSESEDSANITIPKEVAHDKVTQSDNATPDSASSPAISSREGSPPKGVSEHLESQNIPRTEDGFPASQLISNGSQQGFGETSFSMAGPVSGRLSYSGGVPYSGSISLRSDSSTTSNRSFAFPVLQTEWNSSPVRMVKADQRHFRKHRSWSHTLLCCKF